MTLGQRIGLTRLLNGESSRAITALQILEAIDRNSAGSGCELQEPTLLLGIPSADDLPKVLNDFILLFIASIIGMFLPVIDINISDTTNEQF